MFPFNLTNTLEPQTIWFLVKKRLGQFHRASRTTHIKYFEDSRSKIEKYTPPSPGEIRQSIEKLSRCSNCQFLIFDNYWSEDVDHVDLKICPTCGHRATL